MEELVNPITEDQVETTGGHKVVLFNDDINTFDYVISTLIEVCQHLPEQAEQCALITHYKGRCVVKTGTMSELKPINAELGNRELTADIH